jgi:hypothetical protein
VTHPTNSSAAPRRRRILRELGAALVLVVVVVVFAIGQRWQNARREVAEAVADADRLDPGWRFEDMEAQRQLPPPERNSALQVLKVKSLLPRGWPHLPPDPNGKIPAVEEEPQAGTLEPLRLLDEQYAGWLREALTRARPALDQARKLADMPEGRYPITWADDVDSTPCPWSDAFYPVESLLSLDGQVRSQDGDSDGALRDGLAILNVGRSLGEEPFYGGTRYRLGCRFRTAGAIERTLAQGQPSDAALASTQEALRDEDAVPLFLPYFRGDRAITHRFLAQVDDGKHRISEWG